LIDPGSENKKVARYIANSMTNQANRGVGGGAGGTSKPSQKP
jgi:hypothetical protein